MESQTILDKTLAYVCFEEQTTAKEFDEALNIIEALVKIKITNR